MALKWLTGGRMCRADFDDRGATIEGKQGVKTIADFRSLLMELVYRSIKSGQRGILVLLEPAVSKASLDREWALARDALRSRIIRRLSMVSVTETDIVGWPSYPDPETIAMVNEVISRDDAGDVHMLPRPDSWSVVLRVLIERWFLGNRPITARDLGTITGFSYPTLARALERLANVLDRGTDRSIRLARFPEEQWLALVVNASRIRSTRWYQDVSGSNAGVEWFVDRLASLKHPDVAVGGALAGRRYDPSLDLVGTSRLDLCVHAPTNQVDLSFLKRLNPALERIPNADGPCHLALHFVRSANPMFLREGPTWAGPVETLLDLHELGFGEQADQLRAHLEGRSHG